MATPETAPPSIPQPSPTAELPFPLCDDLHELEAPAEWYRDNVSVALNAEPADIRDWALRQPGFESLWIDRDKHNGWISIAFSEDATQRQADVVARHPDEAVVVIPVSYDTKALRLVAQRALQRLVDAGINSVGGGFYEQYGVIHIDLPYLEPQWLTVLEDDFADQPLCVSGQDPALKPLEGPQPQAGDGWRLLADEDKAGNAYRTGIAYDQASYAQLWHDVGLSGTQPDVDFNSDVVIWFGAVHGSSCPRLRLDDLIVDADRALVYGSIAELGGGVCTADEIPHAYVVALARSRLPHGPFAIQRGADDPPPGAPEERTVVDADLSAPGAATDPSHIHQAGQIPH